MSGRLQDIEARIGAMHQLSSVIAAMRGLASARKAEAARHLESVRTYAGTVAVAIGEALRLSGHAAPMGEPSARSGRHIVIAIAAEQGFAGGFSRRVLEQVRNCALRWKGLTPELLLIGDRGLIAAREMEVGFAWSTPMVTSTADAAPLANRIMDELYQRLPGGACVSLVHAQPGSGGALQMMEKQLVPFDFSRFSASRRPEIPLVNMPADMLLKSLSEEYVFAELCEALILSLAAENDERMRSMVAAQQHGSEKLEELVAEARRLRQEEITSEIGELSSSILAR